MKQENSILDRGKEVRYEEKFSNNRKEKVNDKKNQEGGIIINLTEDEA